MVSISIAMATYNGASYIDEQLRSLASQTIQPTELVICDDGSTDSTVALIEGFARHAPFPVRLHLNPSRLGYRANFMKAATLCVGDFIAFSDQDDIWLPYKLQRSAEALSEKTLLTHHNASVVNEKGKIIRRYWLRFDERDPTITGSPLMYLVPPGFAILFRRELLAFSDLWTTSIEHEGGVFAHDTWVFFLGSLLGDTIFINEDLVRYRLHSRNVYGVRKYPIFGLPRGMFSIDMFETIKSRLSMSASWYRKQSMSATNRADIIRQLMSRVEPHQAARLRDRFDDYERIACYLDMRIQLYELPNFYSRMTVFRSLLRAGAYRLGPRASFEKRALLRDMCFGVPFGSLNARSAKD